jgi:hypothetical protein
MMGTHQKKHTHYAWYRARGRMRASANCINDDTHDVGAMDCHLAAMRNNEHSDRGYDNFSAI